MRSSESARPFTRVCQRVSERFSEWASEGVCLLSLSVSLHVPILPTSVTLLCVSVRTHLQARLQKRLPPRPSLGRPAEREGGDLCQLIQGCNPPTHTSPLASDSLTLMIFVYDVSRNTAIPS